jgi:hypothetical protein
MERFLARVQRGTIILIGLIIATYAGSYIVSIQLGLFSDGPGAIGEILIKSLVIAIPIMIGAGTIAALPALVIIAIAELRGWRSLSKHVAAGGFIGLVTGLAATGGQDGSLEAMIAGVLAGLCGSFFYWAIAGRNAGNWF